MSIETHISTATDDRLQKMFAAGVHYGYSRSRRHPSTSAHLFGVKNRVTIIDLEKTLIALEQAKAFVRDLGQEGKTLLLVGGKHEARTIVRSAAEQTGLPFVCGRWIGGTLTNFAEIKKRLARLENLRIRRERGELSKYTKRERLLFDREIAKLEEKFGGITTLTDIPHALLVVDSAFERIAVKEAHEKGLPVVAISNVDCDITGIEYPIVGNDAARASISFFVDELVRAYDEGRTAKPTSSA